MKTGTQRTAGQRKVNLTVRKPTLRQAKQGMVSSKAKEPIPTIVDATGMNPPRKLYFRGPDGGTLTFSSKDRIETTLKQGSYAVYYVAGPSRYATLEFEILNDGSVKPSAGQENCILVDHARDEAWIELKITGFVYEFDPTVLLALDTGWGPNHRKLYFTFWGSWFENEAVFPQSVNVFPGPHVVGYCTGSEQYCRADYQVTKEGRLLVNAPYNAFMTVTTRQRKGPNKSERERLDVHGVEIEFDGRTIPVGTIYVWGCLHGFKNTTPKRVRILPGKHLVTYVTGPDLYAGDVFELSTSGTLNPTSSPSYFIRTREKVAVAVGAPVTIDARRISKGKVTLLGLSGNGGLLTASLLSGKHWVSVDGKSFALSVLENGTVDYDPKYNTVLEGRHTATVSVWASLDGLNDHVPISGRLGGSR